jgi:peptidoglycan hydrolase-like amidase
LVRTLAPLAVLTAAVVFASAPHAARPAGSKAGSPQPYVAPAGSGALFLFSGHGYGHGVGMGQWGAQGYAEQGYTYDEILDAYYPGTALGQTTTSSIRVLLTSGQKKLTISSKKAFTVTDGDGVEHTLPAGKTTFGTGLKLAVDGGPATALSAPLTFVPAGGSPLTLGRAYRGQILVDVSGKRLRAVNALPLEQYLYGVVTAEMPSAWLPAALEAQAVAARSYGLANRQTAGPFDIYADGRSQAYLGVSAESVAGRQAVDATAGEVLLYGGNVADTLFSSSTGGWTQSAADAFGPPGRPYLVSVKDPYDTISPYHNWGPRRRCDRQAERVQACQDAQGLGALGRGRALVLDHRLDHGVGTRAPLDVVQRGCPLASGSLAEPEGRVGYQRDAERRGARRSGRGRAEAQRRGAVAAAEVARARRLLLRGQAESDHPVSADERK